MFGKQAREVGEKIKAEVGKAGEVVTAAIILAGAALIVAVIAIVVGAKARPCHAG